MTLDLAQVKSLVVRAPNWVGDIVMATPLFECLRLSFPSAHISCIVRPYARGILADAPWFDQIIAEDDKHWRGFWAVRRQVAAAGTELAILLPNSVRSALPIRLAGVRHIYGYRRGGRSWLITGGPTPEMDGDAIKPKPMSQYYLEIASHLGLKLPPQPRPRLYISPDCQSRGDQSLAAYQIDPGDRVVGLNPGASFGSSKCWPAEYFARLAELIRRELQAKVLLFSGPGEEALAQEIVARCPVPIIDTTAARVKLDLLKPLIRRCDLLITNDTGPRHYAVAFDVPVVVIMGPTDPRYTATHLERTEVIRLDLSCSPCHQKRCPREHECMRGITPEMVLERSRSLLARCGGDA